MPPAAARPSARYRSVAIVGCFWRSSCWGFSRSDRLPVDLPPSRDAPRLNLRISAPGLIAPVLEEQLTQRLERTLAGVPGVSAVAFDHHFGRGQYRSVAESPARYRPRATRCHGAPGAGRHILAVQGGCADAGAGGWRVESGGVHPDIRHARCTGVARLGRGRVVPSACGNCPASPPWISRAASCVKSWCCRISGGLAGYGLSFDDLLQAIRKNPEADPQARASPVKSRSRREPVQSGNLAAVAALPVMLPDGAEHYIYRKWPDSRSARRRRRRCAWMARRPSG